MALSCHVTLSGFQFWAGTPCPEDKQQTGIQCRAGRADVSPALQLEEEDLLDQVSVEVYRYAVSHPGWTPAEASDALGYTSRAIDRAVEELQARCLLFAEGAETPVYTAVSPDVALAELVDPDERAMLELRAFQQWLIHPAIGIGVAFRNMVRVVAMHKQQVKAHAPRRRAIHGIQYMRSQASRTRHLFFFPSPQPQD